MSDPTQVKVSAGTIGGGVWCVVPVDGHVVRVWMSTLSGLERVYVDDRMVVEQRSFSLRKSHDFDVDGKRYTAEVAVTNPFLGLMRCAVIEDGRTLKAFEITPPAPFGRTWTMVVAIFVIGVVVGAGAAMADVPGWAFVLGLAALTIGALYLGRNRPFRVTEVPK